MVMAIKLTEHPELRWLMSFEFHKDGSKDFDPKEPDNYLKRLHSCQSDRLKKAKDNWLTAIITFGDGNIDHTMGGYFDKTSSIVHPNASFGLFYKHPSSKGYDIELVFYTRFLTISYKVRPVKDSIHIRKKCRELETKTVDSERKTIKEEIRKKMLKLVTVSKIPEISKTWFIHPGAKITQFKIVDWWFIEVSKKPKIKLWVPWFAPKHPRRVDGKLMTPIWLHQRNTIHGLFNTAGCWMLLRNFLWLWPNEYRKRDPDPSVTETKFYKTDYFYTGLNRCYVNFKTNASRRKCVKKILNAKNPPPTGYQPDKYHEMFKPPASNYAYFEFIRIFTGIKYTHYSKAVRFPKDPIKYQITEQSSNRKVFKTNITIPGDDYLKDEWVKFGSGDTRKIESYKSAGGVITLYSDAPFDLKKGQQFEIAKKLNCWKKKWPPSYGANFFGYDCTKNKERYWGDSYIFRRTDEFDEEGDVAPFK